jgi:phosphoribosylanthranilate isomerase
MQSGIKIKVCGIRDAENIREVAVLNLDYLGFIFYESSPRFVGHDFMASLDLPSSIEKVGVFVKHSIDFVTVTMKMNQLNYAQLHGDESVSYCEALKQQGVKVIKVFRVDDEFDFENTKPFEPVADYFLFDTKGKIYGGNAKPFDWNLLSRYNQAVPFFLSGGIHLENIQELKNLSSLNLHAIDINSGVEERPGFKSVSKISEIINQIHI